MDRQNQNMTVKEAILKVLENQKIPLTAKTVDIKINENKYFDWKNAKTPLQTIGAALGDFIRDGDARVKRIKGKEGFEYYLSKFEDELNLEEIIKNVPEEKTIKSKSFQERDLHKLLSSFLKNKNIYSKTIFHEKSTNNKDNHQSWLHPDMIGIKLLDLKNKSSQSLLKVINKAAAFELISYEIKRDIKSDYALKQYYFQAISNSSWANYGYLVVFDIDHTSSSLMNELERLNHSFGIGVIKLKANPFKSVILFPPKYKELDFKTIDKLCTINPDFNEFIEHTEKLLTAGDGYINAKKVEFETFCDSYFKTDSDSEIEKYCTDKNIPPDKEENSG